MYMANGAPAQKHHYNVPWVIFAIVIALCIVAFLYWKYQVPVDRAYQEGQAPEDLETQAPVGTEGTIPTEKVGELTETSIEKVSGALNVNPVEKTNPFSNIKTNPFE